MAIQFTGKKTCNTCKKSKVITDFYIERSKPDGRMNKCAGCKRIDGEASRDRQRKGISARKPLQYTRVPDLQGMYGVKVS